MFLNKKYSSAATTTLRGLLIYVNNKLEKNAKGIFTILVTYSLTLFDPH